MEYFPMFMKLEGRAVLICGGGKHALEKIERLVPFSPNIKVIAEDICEEIKGLKNITIEQKRFSENDLDPSYAFVVSAEEYDESARIVALCRKNGIPVNAVDIPSLCDFIFPSMIVTDKLCIGISTGGLSPTAAMHIKREMSKILPSDVDEILLWLHDIRDSLKNELPFEKRSKVLKEIVTISFSENRCLSTEEVAEIVSRLS